MMRTRRSLIRSVALAATGGVAAPSIARAQAKRRWRCVTSWAKNLPGPGISAARLAKRITVMSQGELTIDVFAAGEIVPGLNVLDAVSNGTVEMGHSAALFWQGKMPIAPLFTTMPFGLSPTAHAGWIDGEGQALWDELYAGFGTKALLAGNTGPSTAGWFRQPLKSIGDIAGLRIRVTGLGAEIYRRLGATPLVIAPSETYQALERGVIDAAEFLAPSNDQALGLYRVAPHLHYPGFNKPNGASELQIGAGHWRDLPEHLKGIIEAACRAEHDQGLAEAMRANAVALRQLIEAGARPMALPVDILTRIPTLVAEIHEELRMRDALSARILASYDAARTASTAWQRMQVAL